MTLTNQGSAREIPSLFYKAVSVNVRAKPQQVTKLSAVNSLNNESKDKSSFGDYGVKSHSS